MANSVVQPLFYPGHKTLNVQHKRAKPRKGRADSNGVAMYLQIANVLRSQLSNGTWEVGSRLPTVAELKVEYQAAHVTVRQALKLLADEGLIESTRGRGTFVIAQPDKPIARRIRAFEDEEEGLDRRVVIVREKVKTLPPLFCDDGDSSGSFHRLKVTHNSGTIVRCVIEMFIRSDFYRELGSVDKSMTPIAQFLRDRNPAAHALIHTAMGGGCADAELASLLKCSLSSPIIYISRFFKNDKDEIIVSTRTSYLAETFTLHWMIPVEQFVTARITPAVHAVKPQAKHRKAASKTS